MMHWTTAIALSVKVLHCAVHFEGAPEFEGALALASELLVDRPHLLQVTATTALFRRSVLAAVDAAESIEGFQLLFDLNLAFHD